MYNLKGLRKEVNKTQSEIAVLFGCKHNNISMQDNVLRKNFWEEILNKYYKKISTSNVETINNERESTLNSSSDSFREKKRIPFYDDVASIGGVNTMVADNSGHKAPSE